MKLILIKLIAILGVLKCNFDVSAHSSGHYFFPFNYGGTNLKGVKPVSGIQKERRSSNAIKRPRFNYLLQSQKRENKT